MAAVIIHTSLEEEDACKYLVTTSTYTRPLGPLSTRPLARDTPPGVGSEVSGVRGSYRPVSTRDSWCIPTYVSYHDSMEWTGSCHGDASHPPPQESHRPVSDATLSSGDDRGVRTPSAGFESTGSLSSATTQPYLRLSTTGSDQVHLVQA